MTTDDNDLLVQRLAETLVSLMECQGTALEVPEGHEIWCMTHDADLDNGWWCSEVENLARALLPIVLREKAGAIREAATSINLEALADEWSTNDGEHWAAGNAASAIQVALLDLANRHEKEATDVR